MKQKNVKRGDIRFILAVIAVAFLGFLFLEYQIDKAKWSNPQKVVSEAPTPPTLDPRYERAHTNLDAVKEGDYITDSDIIHRCPSKKTCDLGNDDDKDWIVEEITYIYKVLDIVKAKSGDTLVYLFDSETIERWSKSWETLEYLKDSGYRILLEKDRPN